MNKSISFSIIILALIFSGCASTNNSLQSQVNSLEARTKEQDKEIAELKKQTEPTENKVEDTAKNAFNWLETHSVEAWDSPTSVEARARLEKCWNDIKGDEEKKK